MQSVTRAATVQRTSLPKTVFVMAALWCASADFSAAAGTMRAMVVARGELVPQVIAVRDPEAGEVRIKVRAAGVNPADWKRAARGGADAYVPGWDVSGTVEAVGPGVAGYKPGDEVIAFFEGTGGYAQYAVVSTAFVARKPANATFEEAAGIPLVAITAWKALIDVADVQPGQRVLVHGGAGGVGSAAVQIAKHRGAYVVATASPRNNGFLRSIGADEIIDYNTVRFEDRVRDLDVVVNTVDNDTAARSLRVLKPDGILVNVAGTVEPESCAAARVRCATQSRNSGTPIDVLLSEVAKLVEAGKYDVHIDATVPLADAARAWDMNRTGHTRGKIVLVLED